jgi:hypothetical protein
MRLPASPSLFRHAATGSAPFPRGRFVTAAQPILSRKAPMGVGASKNTELYGKVV